MKHRLFIASLALCFFIAQMHVALAQQQSAPQTPAPQTTILSESAARIKLQLSKYKTGDKFTALLIDGREYYGALAELKSDEFVITEGTTKQLISVKYADVRALQKGSSYTDPLSGKRKNTRLFLIVAAIGAAAIIIPIIISHSRDRTPVFTQ